MTFLAVCTAVLHPGAVTQRVMRVKRPTAEAKRMIRLASEIARGRRRREGSVAIAVAAEPAPRNPRRLGPVAAHPKSNPARPFRCIGVSVYLDDLAKIDAAVARLRASGRTRMTRSELLRDSFFAAEGIRDQ